MDKTAVVEVIERLRGMGLKSTPVDLRPVGREWVRQLEHATVHPVLFGDALVAQCRYWPTVPEMLAILGELSLPQRKTEGCCEDGWVEVSPWPRLHHRPCLNCQPAAYNAWLADDRDGFWEL